MNTNKNSDGQNAFVHQTYETVIGEVNGKHVENETRRYSNRTSEAITVISPTGRAITYEPEWPGAKDVTECYFVIEDWVPGTSTVGMGIDGVITGAKNPTDWGLGIRTTTKVRLDYLLTMTDGVFIDKVGVVLAVSKYSISNESLKQKLLGKKPNEQKTSFSVDIELMDPKARLPIYYLAFSGNVFPLAPNRDPRLEREGVCIRIKDGVSGEIKTIVETLGVLLTCGSRGFRLYETEHEAIEDKMDPLKVDILGFKAELAKIREEREAIRLDYEAKMRKLTMDVQSKENRIAEREARLTEKTVDDQTSLYINGLKFAVAAIAVFKLWGVFS